MIKKLFFFAALLLLHSVVVNADEIKFVQIFDPKQDQVVKAVQLSKEIYNMAVGWIKSIDGIYGKNNSIKDDGYAVKIPIVPAVKVQSQWLNTVVNEIYLIIPEKDPPFFIVFETDNRVICFWFKGDLDSLSNLLDFNLRKYDVEQKYAF